MVWDLGTTVLQVHNSATPVPQLGCLFAGSVVLDACLVALATAAADATAAASAAGHADDFMPGCQLLEQHVAGSWSSSSGH